MQEAISYSNWERGFWKSLNLAKAKNNVYYEKNCNDPMGIGGFSTPLKYYNVIESTRNHNSLTWFSIQLFLETLLIIFTLGKFQVISWFYRTFSNSLFKMTNNIKRVRLNIVSMNGCRKFMNIVDFWQRWNQIL